MNPSASQPPPEFPPPVPVPTQYLARTPSEPAPPSPYGAPAPVPPLPPYGPPPPFQPLLPPASRTMARWALVLSLLPFVFLVGAGLAIRVLVKGRDSRNHGRGLAIAALVLSGLWLLVSLAAAAVGVVQGLQEALGEGRDEQGQVVERTELDLLDLRVGDCFDDTALAGAGADDVEVSTVEAVPCAQSHQFELYSVFDIVGPDFPGVAAVQRQADQGCADALADFLGVPTQRSSLEFAYYYPQESTWNLGDRSVQCLVVDPSGPVTGSLRGSGR